MNKLVMGIIAIVIVALSAGFFVSKDNSDDEYTVNGEAYTGTSQDESQPVDEIALNSSGAQAVQTYSEAALADSSTDNNLIFFHAAWCSVCNSVEQNIEAGSIPDSLTIFKVDYDSPEGQTLAGKYNIPIQYTMVQVDTDGKEVTQWVNQFNDGVDDIVGNLKTI